MFPDDSGDRRSGHPRASPKTSVSRQDLGSRGQFGTDVVAATTAQADQRVHCPPAPAWTPCSVTVEPNTPLLTETDSGRRDTRLPPTPTAHQRPLVAGLARAGTFSPSLPATLTNKAVAAHTPPLPSPPPQSWALDAYGASWPALPHAEGETGTNAEIVTEPMDQRRHLTGSAVNAVLESATGVFLVVATAPTTHAGLVDDLDDIANACEHHHIWLYTSTAPTAEQSWRRPACGISTPASNAPTASSSIHTKWLFAPYDWCALLYRGPTSARRAQSVGALSRRHRPR